jgi:hypothetical protein
MITRLVECDGRPYYPASDKHARRIESHEPEGEAMFSSNDCVWL